MPGIFRTPFAILVFFPILFSLSMASRLLAGGTSMRESKELTVVYEEGLAQPAQQVLAEYPGISQELEAVFQWPLDFRTTVVLINDEKRFRRLAGHALVVAYALPETNTVVIDYAKLKPSLFRLQTTFKHELCHLLLHHYISAERLPRWLDEGICQWASAGFADILMDHKRALLPAAILSDKYFALEKLEHQFPRNNDALILAYEQSKSMVEFINLKYGPEGMLHLLDLLKQGYAIEAAVETSFMISLHELQIEWRDHVGENINWFTYLSIHVYEILFVSAALLTIWGFVRKTIRRRSFSAKEEDDDEAPLP